MPPRCSPSSMRKRAARGRRSAEMIAAAFVAGVRLAAAPVRLVPGSTRSAASPVGDGLRPFIWNGAWLVPAFATIRKSCGVGGEAVGYM